MNNNQIIQGDALTKLKELEAESVDCCITSPPYWALRDYKTEGQLGLEPTFTEYIQRLVEIFAEVKRILKKTGSCWVDMGDTYGRGDRQTNTKYSWHNGKDGNTDSRPKTSYSKSLLLIPQRFQIAMVDAGWICRNTIIWFKPNCMPSSAKDRFTVDFEYLFFFTKSQKYYFETQYEPLETPLDSKKYTFNEDNRKSQETRQHLMNWPKFGGNKAAGYGPATYSGEQREISPLGRIKRCVWKIPTQPFSEAHFAVFPPAIVETPLKATCPEYVCKKCGRPREKIVEKEYSSQRPPSTTERMKGGYWKTYEKSNYRNMRVSHGIITAVNELGWNQCDCNTGFDGGIVLDPFMGSGTVALVAMQNARNFIGIELNEEYIKMAKERLEPYLLQTRLPI